MLTYLLLWFPMLPIAIANGILRESFIKKYTTDFIAHQLSTITLLLFFGIYFYVVLRRWPPSSSRQAVFIGLLWFVLTLIFEFGFGRWRGNSWEMMLSEYNLAKGKLWLLVPVWVAVAPYFFYKLVFR